MSETMLKMPYYFWGREVYDYEEEEENV